MMYWIILLSLVTLSLGEEVRRQEARRQEARRKEAERQEAGRQEAKRHDARSQEGRRQPSRWRGAMLIIPARLTGRTLLLKALNPHGPSSENVTSLQRRTGGNVKLSHVGRGARHVNICAYFLGCLSCPSWSPLEPCELQACLPIVAMLRLR